MRAVPNRPAKALVGVIDASPLHGGKVVQALMSFYQVAAFTDTQDALLSFRRSRPTVVVVDETSPPFGGREAINRIRNDALFRNVPIIATTAHDSSFALDAKELGCEVVLPKPFRRSVLVSAISRIINRSIERQWEGLEARHYQALQATLNTFNGIADLIDQGEPIGFTTVCEACLPLTDAVKRNDFKSILNGVRGHDNYSYVHSLRVATFLSLFGHAMGLDDDSLLLLTSGGLLHDVGKMSIPYEVLNKPGRLNPVEFDVMRSHVTKSVSYLDLCPTMPKGVAIIAGQHHEKLDGTGYPNGLKGRELNDLARMGAIVDVFSALTDRRCYKPPMEPEKALTIMREEMASHLDQSMLRVFVDILLSCAEESAAG